jgi:hypothetical protein
MCHPARCRRCGKTTWTGCGQHVDQVMAGVPRANRCEGHPGRPTTRPGDRDADAEGSTGWLSRLLGR